VFYNVLNLQLKKIRKVIKQIFTAAAFSAMLFSCNDESSKNVSANEEQAEQEAKSGNSDVVNLDTAKDIKSMLCQDWVLEGDADGIQGMEEDSKFEVPYRSFSLSAAGTFVKSPRNSFDYGSWNYDDASKTLTLNNSISRSKDVYKVRNISYKKLELNNGADLKFIAPGKRFKNANEEPYSIENNRWRIKPTAKESDSAIHQRLKENLKFFILFYKSALAKNDTIISFWGLPSCFKWYGGAIFIKKKEELKENWINCFYNKEQAMQAYGLADRLLSQKYDWPKGERNWLKLNLAVVELMYKKIDEVR
jgi:hypothetical protein